MTDDELAAAYMGASTKTERDETLDQVEQFKRSRSEALAQVRLDLAAAEALRLHAIELHDQIDSAEWLAHRLVELLSREDRRLDHAWRGQVERILRLLQQYFGVAIS